MTISHTPGPWHLDAKHLSIGSADGLRSIANVAIPGEYGTSMPADVIAADANARLIAAAPEMLEALIALLEDAEALAMQAKMPLLPGRVTKAHAAIAKATLP